MTGRAPAEVRTSGRPVPSAYVCTHRKFDAWTQDFVSSILQRNVVTSHVCQQLQVTDGLVPRQRANGPDRYQRVNDLDAGWAIPPATQSCGAAHRCICQRQPAKARKREPGAIVQRRRCPRVCRRLLVAGASRPRTGMPLVCDVALLAESGFNFVTIFLALSGFTLVTMSSPQDEHFGRAVEHRRPLPTAARAPSDHHPPSSTLSRVSQA